MPDRHLVSCGLGPQLLSTRPHGSTPRPPCRPLLIGLLPGTVAAAAQSPSTTPGGLPGPIAVRRLVPDPGGLPWWRAGFEHYFLFFGDPLVPGSTCGVLENDSDPDGDSLSVATVIGGQHRSVILVDPSASPTCPKPDWSTPAGRLAVGRGVLHGDRRDDRVERGQDGYLAGAINDPPTTAGGSVTTDETTYSAAGRAPSRPGRRPTKSAKTVSFVVTALDQGGLDLFDVDPAIASDGTLSFAIPVSPARPRSWSMRSTTAGSRPTACSTARWSAGRPGDAFFSITTIDADPAHDPDAIDGMITISNART